MSQLFRRSQNARQLEKGQGLVEYALILVLVAVVVIAVLSLVGPSVGNIFSTVQTALRSGGDSQYCQIQYGDSVYEIYEISGGSHIYIDVAFTNPGYPRCP